MVVRTDRGIETALRTVLVDQFTNGILDPNQPMLGPVQDGGHLMVNTAPGCCRLDRNQADTRRGRNICRPGYERDFSAKTDGGIGQRVTHLA